MARVKLCDEIVEPTPGLTYVCGRHTRDKNGKCQAHRPPPAEKGRPDPLRPRQVGGQKARS